MMTDNRTTELLRELRRTLEKCRRTEEAGFDTYWITAVALDTSLDELEQAIAATLGNTTCEYVIEDNMNESEGMGDVWFRCTNCDTCYDYYADDWLLKMLHCPKCGATVKGVR